MPTADLLGLKGHAAMVVGAGSGGIGMHCTLSLAGAGASIIAIDVSADRLEGTLERLAELDADCVGIVADATNSASVEHALAEGVERFGAIRHLINVVGGTQPGTFHQTHTYSDELFEEVINLNLRGMFVPCRALARHMLGRGGTIVNFGSVSGLLSAPYHGLYGAAKAGVMALTRTMAVEYGPAGIRVNAVAPGEVPTGRTMKATDAEARFERARAWNPLARVVRPEEVAATVLFLSSDMSSAITGQTLNIDAGITARSPFGGLERWISRAAAAASEPDDGHG